ncbi:MAG: ribonuclease HII [Patescibacteria group bacterium]
MAKYIIGIDEVGRGALAGPVTVAAVALPLGLEIKGLKRKAKFRDSKKLSPRQRESFFKKIKENKLPFAVAGVSPKIIDRINVSQAANLAAVRAVNKLIANYRLPITKIKVFLDGGLYLKSNLKSQNSNPLILNSIIKGDEKISAIALASIVAKVTRDRYMKKLHRQYPCYDFMNNVGYGTERHLKALKKFGHSAVHRRSFRIRSFAGRKFSE